MKSLRSICFALLGVFSACMGVLSCLVMPMVHAVSLGFTELACGLEKLKRELVQNFNAPAQTMTGVGCGLTAEGNGFRQSSVVPEQRTAFAL